MANSEDSYWSICGADVHGRRAWFSGSVGHGDTWSSDWTKRTRIGSRAAALSKLWHLRGSICGRISLVKVSARRSAPPRDGGGT